MAVIGIDLGGTKLATAIFSREGSIENKQVIALDHRRGAAVGALITHQTQTLLAWAATRNLAIEALGVSVPGIYYAKTGRVWAPNIPGWDDYPLLAEMTTLAGQDVKVKIDSDRACYILGETWQGCAQGCKNAVFLAVGTGIGAGILIDGKVLRGHSDIAGAIGWLALDRPFRPAYEACGCFEYHASGTGLAKVARALLAEEPAYTGPLRQKEPDDLTAKDVFAALDAGDALAASVLNNSIAFWAMAVANVVSLFNPEMIVFGGGVFGPAARFIDRIRDEALRWGQPISMQQVRLAVTRLGGRAGLYGAARLAMTALESTR